MALELGLKSRSGGPSAPKASRGLGSCSCQEQTAGKEHVPSSSGLHTRARRFVLGFVCLSGPQVSAGCPDLSPSLFTNPTPACPVASLAVLRDGRRWAPVRTPDGSPGRARVSSGSPLGAQRHFREKMVLGFMF